MTEPHTPAIETSENSAPSESLVTITNAVYILQAVGLFVLPLFIAAVVINYVKRDDVIGTWLESHFRWQIKTFWYGLLWSIVGLFLWILLIGYVIHAVVWIWLVYRIVKGWLDLVEKKPMYRNR